MSGIVKQPTLLPKMIQYKENTLTPYTHIKGQSLEINPGEYIDANIGNLKMLHNINDEDSDGQGGNSVVRLKNTDFSGNGGIALSNKGRVGINNTNPKALLHVQGGGIGGPFSTNVNNDTYIRKFDRYGINNTYVNSVNVDASIFCNRDVACRRVYVGENVSYSSDRRIKEEIQDINDESALVTLREIKPKTYKYIDKNERGDKTVYGFIAQDIKEDLPHAHAYTTNLVPNIYDVCNVVGDTLVFENDISLELDKDGEPYKTLTYIGYDKEERNELKIVEVIDSKTLRYSGEIIRPFDPPEKSEDEEDESDVTIDGQIFVIGQEVDNFNTIKKDYIFTVTTCALQEVDRQLQAEKEKVSALETQLQEVMRRLNTLEQNA